MPAQKLACAPIVGGSSMSTIDRQRTAAVNALEAMLAIARSFPGFEPPLGLMDVLG